ncbi:hypothetical protein [Novosphingobium terrae]|uniref:hypothetical protein n=1 Tax=Novosphingobium terrae TaxID=2726189 RepID=UPI00197F05BF|nr:hypothetical protein [Novosphingobium terrae]
MSNISVGPAEHQVKPAEQQEGCETIRIDAQKANDIDTREGRAGEEAKPFSRAEAEGHHLPPHRPGDSDMAPDEPNDMISERRNASRDDTGRETPVESEKPAR